MDTRQMYSIGDAASICSVSVKTLRYYEKIGLVAAAEKNQETGYRYYKKEQLIQIQLIKQLKILDFPLNEIRELLHNNNISELARRMEARLETMNQEIQRLQSRYMGAEFFLRRIKQGNDILSGVDPSMSAEEFSANTLCVEEIPARNVISVRRIQEVYHNEDINIDRWGEVLEIVKNNHMIAVGPITVTYHNPPLEQFYRNTCDYEVSIDVLDEKNHPRCKKIDSFLAVTTMHIGSYSKLISPTLMAMKWISEKGYDIAGPISDAFIISPSATREEEDYLTKIIIPIKKNKTLP